eukprot:SAG31_NODE_11291_length_1045_cov_1.160677_1_plen_75_part_00
MHGDSKPANEQNYLCVLLRALAPARHLSVALARSASADKLSVATGTTRTAEGAAQLLRSGLQAPAKENLVPGLL